MNHPNKSPAGQSNSRSELHEDDSYDGDVDGLRGSSGLEIHLVPGSDRMEALAEFAAGAGHEVNNPLATILGRVQLLQQNETDTARLQALATIGAQTLRIRDMISDVMLFARPNLPKVESVNAGATLRRSSNSVAENKRSAASVTLEIDDRIELKAEPQQLAIVFDELLRNCYEAVDEDSGEIHVSVSRQDDEVALIAMIDNGRGFSETEQKHLFDPFFSGRQAGRGLGFGLCKCWRIIDSHGGRIEVDSDPALPRTCVSVFWPIAN